MIKKSRDFLCRQIIPHIYKGIDFVKDNQPEDI